MKKRNIIWIVLAIATLIAILSLALQPKLVPVEVASATRGPLQQTIDAEGKTRVHDKFVIAAPVSGRMSRINLSRGDAVAQFSVITRIEPVPLNPLDPRQYAEAKASVSTAESALKEARATIARVDEECEQARRERERTEKLLETGDIPRQEFERARSIEATCLQTLRAARFRAAAAESSVEAAKAALIPFENQHQSVSSSPVVVRSPIGGKVLRLIEESERVITAGTPLLELSNPSNLEIVIDVLSSDAVRISPGTPISIKNWGGDSDLRAQVRLVEPSAFTKISALGVEEQRVDVIADFLDPPGQLGDGYRVEASIIIWQSDDVLQIPASALFRHGDRWSVFVIDNGLTHQVDVEIGHRNPFSVEILEGLSEGNEVIIHPANDLTEGIRVQRK